MSESQNNPPPPPPPPHAKEPWGLFANGHCIQAADGPGVAMCSMARRSPEENAANARRIVACVNMCAGLPVDLVEFVAKIENPLTRLVTLSQSAQAVGHAVLTKLVETRGVAAAEAAVEEANRYAAQLEASGFGQATPQT